MARKVRCWNCNGSGRVRRPLPPIHRGALGVPQTQKCPECNGRGYLIEERTGYRTRSQDEFDDDYRPSGRGVRRAGCAPAVLAAFLVIAGALSWVLAT